MADSIYEAILKGTPKEKIAEMFKLELQDITDIAAQKIDYDGLSGQEKEKVLHTLSLISSKSWQVFEQCDMQTKVKVLDLIRRLTSDRSDILGLKKTDVNVSGDLEISWRKD
jgi:hypothetical protein